MERLGSSMKKKRRDKKRRRVYRARYVSCARDKGFPQIGEWVHVRHAQTGLASYAICTRLIGPEKVRLFSFVWGRGHESITVQRSEIEPVGKVKINEP